MRKERQSGIFFKTVSGFKILVAVILVIISLSSCQNGKSRSNALMDKTMRSTNILFKTGNIFIWLVQVYEIQGRRFYKAVAIPCTRQAGIDIAKYPYRPEARNGIK